MRVAILGATGTLGQELIRQILAKDKVEEIVGVSRCELKQKETAERFKNKKLRLMIGDIRDERRMRQVLRNIDVCYHVAALKHIDSMEENPEESVKTNILGTINSADAAIDCGVKYFVFSSTDKAVDPVNCYGMCKGVSEKILFSKNKIQNDTRFRVYRWGNVLFSRGSALHYFAEAIRAGKPVNLTHPEMTRFWIKIEDAVAFMISTYQTGASNSAMIPNMKASSVEDVIASVALILRKSTAINITGPRVGEKIHEAILSHHERPGGLASNTAAQYSRDELTELLRPFVEMTQ